MINKPYTGPDKINKGKECGACNRDKCQTEPAIWYNHKTKYWYCKDCRYSIQFDYCNLNDWKKNYEPTLGHPMFETRAMIVERERLSDATIVYIDQYRTSNG